MGVYIKGMEMPAGCSSCLFRRTDYLLGLPACTLIFEEIPDGVNWDEKLPECPLTEVPEPHGRLIDADALHKLFEDQWHYLQVLDWNENPTAEAMQSGINWCINTMHDDAPTVIPASEEVYNKYTDTAGNLHWTGTQSGKHIIPASESQERPVFLPQYELTPRSEEG